MSIGSKKKEKDKDKDAKGASGVEASTDYIVGSTGGEGRSTNTRAKQEPGSTTIANNKLSTREDTSGTQRETVTSPSPSSSPSQDEILAARMMAAATSSASASTSTSKEVPYQYQYQQNFQQYYLICQHHTVYIAWLVLGLVYQYFVVHVLLVHDLYSILLDQIGWNQYPHCHRCYLLL
jgi:hypothetical protein